MRDVSTDITIYHFQFERFLNLNKPGSLFTMIYIIYNNDVSSTPND